MPSPEPRRILEIEPITWLLERGAVVICAGGGGIMLLLVVAASFAIAQIATALVVLGLVGFNVVMGSLRGEPGVHTADMTVTLGTQP